MSFVLSDPTARTVIYAVPWFGRAAVFFHVAHSRVEISQQQGGSFMRYLPLLFAMSLLVFVSGCSCNSQIEREDLTSSDAREIFIEGHPESAFQENIRNGEIIRGMNEDEVIASWGMPNVYLTSTKRNEERFIYYLQDKGTNSVLVYMLDFDGDNILHDWDIDEKRISSYSLVGYEEFHVYTSPGMEIGKVRK